jgi:hypothetical protein
VVDYDSGGVYVCRVDAWEVSYAGVEAVSSADVCAHGLVGCFSYDSWD